MRIYMDITTITTPYSDDAFEELTLVVLTGCGTGEGGESGRNLVNAFYERGADVVIGFLTAVESEDAIYWTRIFMEQIAAGKSVQEALTDADNAIEVKNPELTNFSGNMCYTRGNLSITPCR